MSKDNHFKGCYPSTSNFIKHLKNKHTGSFEKYQEYKKKTTENNKRKYQSLQPDDNCQQLTLENSFAKKKRKPETQESFNNKLITFMVQTMVPLSVIDSDSFRDLFSSTDLKVLSRRSVVRQIEQTYKTECYKIKESLRKSKFVCSTADIWSAKRRSFMGTTVHYIDDDLKRHSFGLACRRFAGTHSYDRIAELLEDINLSFELDSTKIVSTITDNGSNFVKAFAEFGIKFPINEEEDAQEESDNGNDNDLNFGLLNHEYTLPKHKRCASHTLNLLATTDINNILKTNQALKSRHEKVLQKCNVLWNKAGRPKSAEIIQMVLGHTLSYPAVTRWNSLYSAIKQIITEKDKLKELYQKLDIKDGLKEAEIIYLEEYLAILSPVAETLNFLQGERNTFYGYLLPSIISLKVKFDKLKQDLNIKNLQFVVEKLVMQLQKRFQELFSVNDESLEAIIASVTIPSVKLRWLNVYQETDPTINKQNLINTIINKCCDLFHGNIFNGNGQNVDLTNTNITQDDAIQPENDFFDFKEEIIFGNDDKDKSSRVSQTDIIKNKLELELLQYLEDKRTNIEMLHDYTLIKQIFIRYNTSLPSSAAVERMFNFATLINTSRRHALSDNLFEQLVFLKANLV